MDRREFLKLAALATAAPAALANAQPIISTNAIEVLQGRRYVPIGRLEHVRPGDVFRMLHEGKVLDAGTDGEVCLALKPPELIDLENERGRTWMVVAEYMPAIATALRELPWVELGPDQVFIGTPRTHGRSQLAVYLVHPTYDQARAAFGGKLHLFELAARAGKMVAEKLRHTFPEMGWDYCQSKSVEFPCCVKAYATHRYEDIPFCSQAPGSAMRWRVFGRGLDISHYAEPGAYLGEGHVPTPEQEKQILELLAKAKEDPRGWLVSHYGITFEDISGVSVGKFPKWLV